tara:strand:- start:126 stop:539 length:414 start_codon:yes stop_codon:yes gene_type:complete
MSYRFLEHTADVKFLASGKSLEQAFVSAADALIETIAGKIKILGSEEKKIKVDGKDMESLLYNFLEEFLFLLDSEDFLVGGVKELKIDVEKFKLSAVLVGDKASNYKFTNDVKAITYNEMFVKKQKNKYVVQVVVDV